MAGQPAARSDRVAELLARYRPPAGVSDELIDGSGAIRPVWRPFIDHLAGLSGDEIAHRLARGDRYLQDAGVYYRQYGEAGAAERDWPLSHVPVLIDEAEWQTIVTGIKKMLTTTDELAEWQLAMATAVLAMLPPVAVVIFMQRLFVRGLVETEK